MKIKYHLLKCYCQHVNTPCTQNTSIDHLGFCIVANAICGLGTVRALTLFIAIDRITTGNFS
jgi:hypothetical protein